MPSFRPLDCKGPTRSNWSKSGAKSAVSRALSPARIASAQPRIILRLRAADALAIRVIVKLHKIASPPEKHGVERPQQSIDDDKQDLGPIFYWPDRGLRPVELAGQIRHLSATENPADVCGGLARKCAENELDLWSRSHSGRMMRGDVSRPSYDKSRRSGAGVLVDRSCFVVSLLAVAVVGAMPIIFTIAKAFVRCKTPGRSW